MKQRTKEEIEAEYNLLENWDAPNDAFIRIENEYYFKGLTGVVCKTNHSTKPNFEYLEICSGLGQDDIIHYYVSIYTPELIVDGITRDIRQDEKELLYSFTFTHWSKIMGAFRNLYMNSFNYNYLKESYPEKDIDHIIFPDYSPDYRLLPSCK